jgi:TPR repeat protein
MYKAVVSWLLLLVVAGCASTLPKESVNVYKSYLADGEFIEVYLSFIEAERQYIETDSDESINALPIASQSLKVFADNGNPIAQFSYGNSQYLIDYKFNAPTFKDMLLKSANSGYLPAKRKLARFYRSGQHFGKHESKALEILESNAEYGHERDIKILLLLYKKLPNIGVNSEKYRQLEKKLALSRDIEYQSKLAKEGDLYAQRLYGHMLFYGKNIKRDYFNAAIWLSVAAQNKGNSQAAYDSARAIYALSKLNKVERLEVDEYVNRFGAASSEI